MSRTHHQSKPPGYDLWSRRYGNATGCNSPGAWAKQVTNRAERRIAKHVLRGGSIGNAGKRDQYIVAVEGESLSTMPSMVRKFSDGVMATEGTQ